MITNKEIEDGLIVVHDRTQEQYEIISSKAQLKFEDGKWIPAVTYRKNSTRSYLEPVFVRDTTTFMANFTTLDKAPS